MPESDARSVRSLHTPSIAFRYLVRYSVLLYVHRNRRLIRDGEPRTSTSTFTQLLSSGNTTPNSKLWFQTDIRPPTTDRSRKLSANGQFFVDAQIAVRFYQTTQIISGVYFLQPPMLLPPAQIKPKSFESRQLFSFFSFTLCGRASCLRACFDAMLLPQSY